MPKAENEIKFQILIDTCVWLDLAKDHRQVALLTALETLVETKTVELILPQTIVDEFDRNKSKIIDENRQSLAAILKRAREIVARFGDTKNAKKVLEELNNADHKLPSLRAAATESIDRIEKLFRAARKIATTDTVRARAAQRAIERRAPFHRGRNSINDAILIEAYADAVSGSGGRFAFVTHNTRDFSDPKGNDKLPHPDIADCFSKIRSLYSISLLELLRRIDAGLLSSVRFEHEWSEEPRELAEILEAIDLLFDQVWYNRHENTRHRIEHGRIKLVDKETFPVKNHLKRPIQKNVWAGALKAAARVEKKHGRKNLGPWSDFEWGMINGKLSALRWVLGDEWDMLDT